jgi:uncharacterized membrane protein
MKEIFVLLALVGVVLLGLTLFQGQKADNLEKETVTPHIGWALGTSIYLMVVHSVIVIYFMGTGFAIKEATDEFQIPEEYLARARALKMKVFPVTTLAIALVVLSIILGASQFTSNNEGSLHKTLAYLTIFLNFGAFYLQFLSVWENGKMMEEIGRLMPEEQDATANNP